MSLVCHECSIDLEPSKELPGREGTMVHPTVLALKYVMLKDGNMAYQVDYLWSEQNRSLCFECIEKKMPGKRRHVMQEIYDCYEAETEYRQIEESNKGKWVRMNDDSGHDAFMLYEYKQSSITKNCIFCGQDPKKGLPYFRPQVIDRIESGKLPSLCGSYQWSHLERGMTSFNICFEDFKKNFPNCFEALSYDLLGSRNQDKNLQPNTIYLPRRFRQAMEGKKQRLDDIIESTEDFVIFKKK